MPFLNERSSFDDWMDPDLVPRPVVTIGAEGVDMDEVARLQALEQPPRKELGFHQHVKGELVLTLRGALSCEVDGGMWMVPPQSALWIPGGTLHKVTAAGTLECYVVFIDANAAARLPAQCCAVSTTPLLRELTIRSASLPVLYADNGIEAHIITLLLDELAIAPIDKLHWPMPTEPRLRRMAQQLCEQPAERGTLATWARRLGMSERSLARLLTQETGMSFGRWRQQLQLMLAVKWLSTGTSVQQVADDLGYESASSFVGMFQKIMGSTPGRYIADRLARQN